MAAGRKTGGRKKGTPNKVGISLKEGILEAYKRAGGVEYLENIARLDPRTFCALLAKVLPTQLTGGDGAPIQIEVVTGIERAPDDPPYEAED